MKLKLKDYRVVNLDMSALAGQSTDSAGFDLQIGHFYPTESDNTFGVGFKVDMTQYDYKLHLEMRFFFESSEPISEEFKNSSFPTVNAPAIAFPYLRSYLSILTMQSGYAPIMIPSVNFVELARQEAK